MDRLPHDPRNFREHIEADLRHAARLIIKVQDEARIMDIAGLKLIPVWGARGCGHWEPKAK